MSAPFPNQYNHRRVAESAAKACDICYKMSSSVLITPDNKDFFYICPIHLKDRYFCTPKIDENAAKENREKELAEEKEKLLKEYQERQDKKAKKEQEKKDKKKDKKEKDGAEEKDAEKDKKASNENSQDENNDDNETPKEEEPRVFELKSAFYQQRLQRRRQAEAAKRGRERVAQPDYFPSVPSEPPSK